MQLGMALMVNPPKEGSESYEQYKQEESSVMDSLRRRAQIMTDGFNACEGVTCSFTEGAMYSFPRLNLSQKVSYFLRYAFMLRPARYERCGYPLPACKRWAVCLL